MTSAPRRLVLVGAGHAHLLVLEDFAARPPSATAVTLVTDTPRVVYSGMVPGFVEGRYEARELAIELAPLAEHAGARLVVTAATGVDPSRRRIELADGRALPYDVASFDVGSTVAGLDTPGVSEHALATRPIGRFVERIDARARTDGTGRWRLAVVGGGAAGVELAFTALERVRRSPGVVPEAVVVESGPRILPGAPAGLARRVERLAPRRGVTLACGRRVIGVEPGRLLLDGGDEMPCDAVLWAAGAAGHPLFTRSGLATDRRGFVRVRSTLQVEHRDDLFAAGDCAALIDHPETPKAGVYAVRQGPLLARNLRAHLAGGRLRSFRPQSDVLILLDVGRGHALGAKWGVSFEGRWVSILKRRIDRAFVRRFSP